MAKRSRFFVALLFDERVADEIDGLRRAFGSAQLARVPPHITLIAPFNLADNESPRPEAALREAAAKLERFDLQLGPVGTFLDNMSVLFLRVEGHPQLTLLRDLLIAALPVASARDHREFVPHATLVSRRDRIDTEFFVRELSHYRREVRIESVSLLIQLDEQSDRPWKVAATYDLGGSSLVGRGGVEIALHTGRGASSELSEAIDQWGVGVSSPEPEHDSTFFALALIGPILVGVATWRQFDSVVDLGVLVISPEHRGIGVGSRLLEFVETCVRSRGAELVTARLDAETETARYLLGRGYIQMGDRFVSGDARRIFGRVL